MYIIGIDIAKKFHQVAIMFPDGSIRKKSFRISNTIDGFALLMEKIVAVSSDLSQFVFAMEATGHYWLNLYTWLADKKFTVHVINPLQSNALRHLYIRKTKTDSVDAGIIAQVIRIGKFSETQLSSDKMIDLRDLCRQRFYLVDMASDLKRKIICMMDRIFPEYEDFFSNMFGKSSIEVLKQATSPEEILALPTEKLSELLQKASRGRFKLDKAEALKNLASTSFAALLSSETISLLVKQMIEQIALLEKQISTIADIISSEFKLCNTKLEKIPGIGTVLGAAILSEIGDIHRFANPKQLTAYAGIDPSTQQSGNFLGSQSHMSKRGSPYLRRALWLAATIAVHNDIALRYLFQRKMNAGKNYSQAIGFICHKLLNIIFVVLKDDVDYVPKFPPDVDVSKLAEKAGNTT